MEIENNIIIKDAKKRSILVEGRDNGMGFAFLRKLKNGTYRTVQAMSPCKDFLNEPITTERYGFGTSAHGLKYPKKLNIFTDKAYMGIKMMVTRFGNYTYSKSFENDKILLNQNYKNIQNIMNKFEEYLGLNSATNIEKANDDNFLLTFSSEWCQSTHAISLYTLLIRCLMIADNENIEIMEFLKNYDYNHGDKNLINSCINKIQCIIDNKKLPPNRINFNNKWVSPHNYGICAWDSKFEEMKPNFNLEDK